MTSLSSLRVKIFADGADLQTIERLASDDRISGFTTNPSLMRKAGVTDYEQFARQALVFARGKPVSLEVFADDLDGMERQARIIASWGDNAVVKLPVMNTKGQCSGPAIDRLSRDWITLNVTALMTPHQVQRVAEWLYGDFRAAYVSVFAGRIADTGIDPVLVLQGCRQALKSRDRGHAQIIWASPRQLRDIFLADACGCDAITVGSDILAKLDLVGKDLEAYSLETVQQFRQDAVAAGYAI